MIVNNYNKIKIFGKTFAVDMFETPGQNSFECRLTAFCFQVINVTGISVGAGLATACDTLFSQVNAMYGTCM